MLCEKCQLREATVDLSEVIDGKLTRRNVCGECCAIAEAEAGVSFDELLSPMLAPERFEQVAAIDGRYPVKAYQFVCAGMMTAKQNKSTPGELGMFGSVSVTADDLLVAWRQLALEWFGMSAKAALGSWGITRTDDFGEIIFRMVGAGLMGQSAGDSRAEFTARYDFNVEFPES